MRNEKITPLYERLSRDDELPVSYTHLDVYKRQSLHPLDLLVGLCCGCGLRLAVYLKSKNAKKYRHGLEYGSARWSA